MKEVLCGKEGGCDVAIGYRCEYCVSVREGENGGREEWSMERRE